MKIKINGELLEIDAETNTPSLTQVLELYGAKPPFAVAINGEFIAQSQYAETSVSTSDLLDVVSPIFGG